MFLEETTFEGPQHRDVDFFGAAKWRSEPFAVDAGGVHYFLVVVLRERSNRFSLQDGESSC